MFCLMLLVLLQLYAFNEFSGGHSCYFLEIPVCCGALTVTYIIEKLVKVGLGFSFQGLYHVVDAAVGDIFYECHPCVVLE